MSGEIGSEVLLLGTAIWLGIILALSYEGLRAWRRICPHGTWWQGVEDLLFWTICGGVIFGMLLVENRGVLRWYVLAGCLAGVVVYHRWFHPWIWRGLRLLWKGTSFFRGIVEKLLKK